MALDPHFNKTVLMLHGDDVGDPYVANLVAGSTLAPGKPSYGTLVIGATALQGSFAGRGGVSMASPSSTSCNAVVHGATTGAYNADFTVEWWSYQTTALGTNAFGHYAESTAGGSELPNAFEMFVYNGTATLKVRGASTSFVLAATLNAWVHHAVVCLAGIASYYKNGVRVAFFSAGTTAYSSATGVKVGCSASLTGPPYQAMPGYVSDIRLYKGVAKYSGDSFTVPAWPMALMTAAVDASNAARLLSGIGSALQPYTGESKFGGGCLRFDGASGLVLPASTDWNFGTGDFTVEAWVKPYVIPGGGVTTDMLVFGSFNATPDFIASLDNATLAPVLWDGTTAYTASSGVATGMWTHVAWSRQNGTLRIFENGEKTLEAACATNFAASTTVGVGYENSSNTRYFNGLVDDLRITKGVARYTENFTPPTQAFPDGQAGVSGVIRDAEGNLCSRKVFVHSRATGRLLGTAVSDPTTGTYEIAAEEECYIVCLDSTDSFNAKIVDGVDPTV